MVLSIRFEENKLNANLTRISKFLSLVLRHAPETIHVNVDKNGWLDIQRLIDNSNKYKNLGLIIDIIKKVVENNDKQRFIIELFGNFSF
jgi:putative RNA 2'-phosphotransferase